MDNPMQRTTREPLPLRLAHRCGARTRYAVPVAGGEGQEPVPNARRREG
jgi:hypothetical protein